MAIVVYTFIMGGFKMEKFSFLTFKNYMNKSPLSACEEDYLEMIYRLGAKNIRLSDLANALSVSNASTSKMVKKLKMKGYLKHDRYQKASLTTTGIEIAQFLYKRHQIIETFFELLKDTNDLVEKVEKIEHTLSLSTLEKIEQLINFFNTNPDIKILFNTFLVN